MEQMDLREQLERATKQKIKMMELPSVGEINKKRIEKFKEKISTTLSTDNSFYENLVEFPMVFF